MSTRHLVKPVGQRIHKRRRITSSLGTAMIMIKEFVDAGQALIGPYSLHENKRGKCAVRVW